MSRESQQNEIFDQSYFLSELESLGLTTIRLNEFNDVAELRSLTNGIKTEFLKRYEGSNGLKI